MRENLDSVETLSQLLADTYVLQAKTQNYHWHLQSTNFIALHSLFETQYNEMRDGIDELAERIRILGYRAPATLAQFLELSSIPEDDLTSDEEMLQALVGAHMHIITNLRTALEPLKQGNDDGTIDLLVERLRAHEKMHWVLDSHMV